MPRAHESFQIKPTPIGSGRSKAQVEEVGMMWKVWEEETSPPAPCVAEQELDIAGDEAMCVLHQPSNKSHLGRPLGGCG
jgi:hypothetical protein